MQHLTVRNVWPDLARALEEEKRRRGASLNQTVLDLLARALGVGPEHAFDNGLADLAGGWSEESFREFEAAVGVFEELDDEGAK